MKELKDFAVAGQSTFLAMTAGLPKETTLAMFAGASGAMVAGHVGKITSIDFEPVQVANLFIERDQVITIGGEEVLLTKYVEGENTPPKAVTIKFDTGRTMTLGLLLQGQDKTKIALVDGTVVTATQLNLGNISANLLGKTLRCDKTFRDAGNAVNRAASEDGKRKERSYAANCYEFTQID
jgi:hypothetical protein